jgi:hypothetical protein
MTLAQTQAAVEQSLREVADGVFAWLTTLERLREAARLPGAAEPGAEPEGGGDAPRHPAGAGAGAGPAASPASSVPSAPPDPVDAPPGAGEPRPTRSVEPGSDPDRGNIVDFRPRPDQPGNGDT